LQGLLRQTNYSIAMKIKTSLVFVALIAFTLVSNGQKLPPREVPAKRTTQPVKIDGFLTDCAWKDAAAMTDYV